jgi:hypothetical protein
MSDDLVKRICKTWIENGGSDDCFWEGWPENPTPDDSLTPGMVLARIEELEATLTDIISEYDKPDNGRSLRWEIDAARELLKGQGDDL